MGTKGVVDQPKEHEPVLRPGQKSYPGPFAPVKGKKGARKTVRAESFSPVCNPRVAYPNSQFLLQTARAKPSKHCRSAPAASNPLRLGQDFMEDVARDVREAEIASCVTVRQAFVIEAEAMQHRRVQIVNGGAILDRSKTELIRGSVHRAAANASAGEPDRETVVIVIPPELGLAGVA